MTPLPAWLQSLTLKKFSASRNLIIDVDPAFPWQITALDGYGGELQLVKNGSWGVWNGSATLNAAAATFNRIDVRRPSLKLNATASTVNITELSAFTERGILQATAAVSQLPQRQVNLSFSGRGVPLNILQAWGWPSLPISGDGNLQLTASGSVAGRCPAQTDGQRAAQRREYGETAGGANHCATARSASPPPRQRPLPSPHSDAHSLSSMGRGIASRQNSTLTTLSLSRERVGGASPETCAQYAAICTYLAQQVPFKYQSCYNQITGSR